MARFGRLKTISVRAFGVGEASNLESEPLESPLICAERIITAHYTAQPRNSHVPSSEAIFDHLA